MASISTPRNKMSRGTESTPAGTFGNLEVNSMSLRSGKRKMANVGDVNTPQKENLTKRRKSNRVGVLKDMTSTPLGLLESDENTATPLKGKKTTSTSTPNNSITSFTPKLKDITKSLQNKLSKDATPTSLGLLNSDKNSASPRKGKRTGGTSLPNNSITSSTPKLRDITKSLRNKLPKDFTPKHLETTNENSSKSGRKSTKDRGTGVIRKSLGVQNDSVIVLTPNPEDVTKAVQKIVRGKNKNAVHPGDFTEAGKANTSSATDSKGDNSCAIETDSESIIVLSPELPHYKNSNPNICNNREEEVSESEMKNFLKHGTIVDSNSFTAAGPSRSHVNNSIDSFVLQPLPDDSSHVLESSSDSEISMTLNTTYELQNNATIDVTSNAISARKSVHFKQTPEILGPRRRSNSFPNISVDTTPNNTSRNTRQHTSTPAARRRAGSTPAPSRKNGSSTTKMPDFSQIHQRNFEKMESLYDFHHRRKGSSQKKVPPVVQERKLPRSTSVMVFKATASSTPRPTTTKIPVPFKPNSRSTPAKPSYSEAKEAIMRKTPVKKTPTHSAPVENNRNILKGVRLNRRFELQMKHRNMK